MTNHPNRSKPNLMFIDGGYAHLVTVDREYGVVSKEIVTCALHPGRYVRIDDGKQYPQLCVGGDRLGNTLSYDSNEQLARDCDARLFKTRQRYEAAKAALGRDC